MKRLIAMVKLDATIQFRNKFYYVGVGISVFLALMMVSFFDQVTVTWLLPMLFLFAIGGTTLLYVAGLMLFEKDEHTLDALTASPLRLGEYLLAKVISLTAIATLESAVVILLTVGLNGFSPLPLFAGIAIMGAMLTLIGIIIGVRYNSITDFLIPMLVLVMPLQLPFLHFAGIAESYLWYLIPTTAPTLLMTAAWRSVEAWQLIYALIYSGIVLVVCFRWAQSAFIRHIVLKERG